MFLQQVGRGLRISAKKEKALFIDNVGLYNRFGLPSATRRWKKHFEGREVDEYEYRGNGQELEINYFDDEIEEGDENIELIHASVNEANNENIMKYKDEYIKYLEYRGYSDATIKMYVSSILKHVDSYITKLIEPNHIHLFDIIETEYIRTLFDNLIDNDTFEFENKLQHNRFSVSFKKYLEFSQDYQKEQPNSELNDNQEEELLLNTPKSPIINTEDELTKTNEMIEFYRERNLPLDKTLLDYKKKLEFELNNKKQKQELKDYVEKYKSDFSSLHTNLTKGHKAPHKIILLLSIIDLIQEGIITSPNIYPSKELMNKFKDDWNKFIGESEVFKPVFSTPFYHLKSEPFWTLHPTTPVPSSISEVDYAIIDSNLFKAISDKNSGAKLRLSLIQLL